MEIKLDVVHDAKGIACSMPIVKTKMVIKSMLLEVQATNSGFTVDMKA